MSGQEMIEYIQLTPRHAVLRPAGQVRSLTELAVTDGFLANPSHQRGFRIGIDASIWFFHAAYGKEGENPELRTLFFRCCRLLQAPLLPLFVFDGPKRPAVKRGKRVGGSAHWLTQGMKNIIEAFGFEWRMAPGEAEAELAYLNSIGVIDAVLSDDVDNFLFGATMVIRNPSSTLSGNRSHPVKNAQGKDDGNHVLTYASSTILSTPSVALSRSGTILIALLSGGDYIPAGLPGCGQKFATGIARAGFGDSLVKAVKELKGARLQAFLDKWRDEVRVELKTNKAGYLPSKKPSLAASLTDDFPSLPVLLSYIDPVISGTEPSSKAKNRPSPIVWRNDPDPMRIAALCELYFEWGVKDVIVSRFRTVLWPGVVCRAVRRGVMDVDARGGAKWRDTHDSDDDHVDTPGPSSPTKQISSALSALALSSPTKSSMVPSASDPPTSTPDAPFSLSSLFPLTLPLSTPASSSSTRSPSPLLLSVLSHRTHPSTDATLEYRVLVDPTILVARAESGVRGLRPPLIGGLFGIDPDEDGDEETADDEGEGSGDVERLETAAAASKMKKRKPKKAQGEKESPTAPLRLWLPACMIRAVAPEIVEAYEEKERAKEEKRTKKGTRGARGGASRPKSIGASSRKTKTKEVADGDDENEDDIVCIPSTSTTGTKSKAKAVKAGVGSVAGGEGRRRKPKHASEAQDDAYELIDLSAGESPCSSDESGSGCVGDMKGKGKGKGKVMATAKDGGGTSEKTANVTKARVKTNVVTAPTTTKGSYNATKSSTVNPSTLKLSQPRKPSAAKPPGSKHVPFYEEEGFDRDSDSAPLPVALALPKSSRPLDLLRSKSKSGPLSVPALTSKLNPSSKSKSAPAPIYEEEEESSPSASPFKSSYSTIHSNQEKHSAPARKKPPAFVDVSDSDLEIEVSDMRGATSAVPTEVHTGCVARVVSPTTVSSNVLNDIVDEKVIACVQSVGRSGPSSSLLQDTYAVKDVGCLIDLSGNGNRVGLRSKSATSTSALASTASLLSHHSSSIPSSVDSASGLGSSAATGTANPTVVARSTSKLAHILLPSLLESEEEADGEGDELPTFHRGSAPKRRAGTLKGSASTPMFKAVPRPFPMPSPSKSSISYSPSRDMDNARGVGRGDDGDVVIIDVFTTPPAPSPPRSPTPTPSPMKSPRTPACPISLVESTKLTDANGAPRFPTSPTKSKVKQHPRILSDSDAETPASGQGGIPKSPRKSATHTSPRHLPRARASSPTSPSSFRCPSGAEEPMPMPPAVRRPRPSDESAIYISSGSEAGDDEHEGLSDDDGGHEDEPVDEAADTAMVLSSPPSLPSSTCSSPALPSPGPARVSRFKAAWGSQATAVLPASSTERMKAGEVGFLGSTGSKHGAVCTISKPPTRAPLLVARAKCNSLTSTNFPSRPSTSTSGSRTVAVSRTRSKPRAILPDDSIIDLTSE
ncbi:hypothetical protein PAXRUDRAFT_767087 [Paxillus rubicundulus Ve08.2h10]|uniref:XPG-I domain-containing protein n=1 Tax=Paxillus rubicundulus Ve08.2h10 TaxID=930991 RepID=A0A0D0DNA9_9AGAM|nr:hypothetical protein PAXRUDRAFT_767087 [Paxillus rubicundulus Ve08.2h10]